MSDVSQGPGWWIASDGQWYPPELHPSVREQVDVPVGAAVSDGSTSGQWSGDAGPAAHVGPHFPDMFQKAQRANALADNVAVMHDNANERGTSPAFAGARSGSGGDFYASAVPDGSQPRRWRRRGR